MPQPNEKRNYALMLMLPVLLLAGCATPSTPSVISCPQLPQKPVAQQPTPPLPYSASVRLKLEGWQKRLTDTQATPVSSPTPGRSD